MTPFVTAIVVLAAIAGAIVLFARWRRSSAFQGASEMAREVLPVWAAQGPFANGARSSEAMRLAYVAVFGTDMAEQSAAAIRSHAEAYDSSPTTWEELRQEALNQASPEALELAKGIAAAESLNKDLLESGGHRLEFTRMQDGSTQVVYNQIWTDAAVEEKRREGGEAIANAIGENLMEADSVEAGELVRFLTEIYRSEIGEEPMTSDLGRVWLSLSAPDEEIRLTPEVREFRKLNAAYSATQSETDENGIVWSLHCGRREAHLKRKNGNLLFPITDRNVSQTQIDEARALDREEADALEVQSNDLMNEIVDMPSAIAVLSVHSSRERIDELLDRAAKIGGLTYSVAETLQDFRQGIMDTWRISLGEDAEKLAAFERAEEFSSAKAETSRSPFIAQMGELPVEDTIPALVSEPPDTIRRVLEMLGTEERGLVVNTALGILSQARSEGFDPPDFDEKVSLIDSFRPT